MICKNCQATITSKFCSECGQKSDVHSITIKHVAHDFFHAFTHTDKGFLLLMKELLTRPGIVTREYIEGKRKKYFNPLSFFIITSAISAFITTKTGYFEALSKMGNKNAHPLWQEAFKISNNNTKLFSLILIAPLITLFCWIFFRKPKHNIAEHFVLHAFIIGQSHIIRILIFVPLFLIFPYYANPLVNAFQVTLFIYLIVAYKQFFNQNIFLTILKTVLVMILFITFYWVLIFGYVMLKKLVF